MGEGTWGPSPNWGTICNWRLLGAGECSFFSSVAADLFPMLQHRSAPPPAPTLMQAILIILIQGKEGHEGRTRGRKGPKELEGDKEE